MFNKIKLYIVSHKVISIIVFVLVILIGRWGYQKYTSTTGDIRYITTKVAKETIISSVSGSGQVSASNQLEIKSKVSGDVVYLAVQNGQKVTAGTLIAQLDSTDAQKSVRDAQLNLASAKLSLEKLKLQNSAQNMSAESVKIYSDGFGIVSDVFLDLPATMTNLENMINSSSLSNNVILSSGKIAQNYRDTTEKAFYAAKKAFEKSRIDFRILSYGSKPTDIENIINETYETNKLVATTLANFKNFLDYLSEDTENSSEFSSYQSSLASYANTTSANLSNLLGAQTNIKNNKDATPGADLDLQSSLLSVEQRQNALQDAKDKLADYSIRAPFDGTIAVVNIKKSDSVSSSTAIATLITKNQIAEISLNEVDVAKIKVGQKATLTFDAITDLSISGAVAEIDSIGTASQGVVTYNVKISFDTQDDRIKPAMSVSADIITDTKQDVLAIPNSAVKSQNNTYYVEIFNTPLPKSTDGLPGTISKIAPKKITVEIGLSNDSKTEIISGLQEGEEIITRTISPTTAKTTATAPSIFGGGGGSRTGATGR